MFRRIGDDTASIRCATHELVPERVQFQFRDGTSQHRAAFELFQLPTMASVLFSLVSTSWRWLVFGTENVNVFPVDPIETWRTK